MTRGIIVYIGINGGYCVSTEFNGDMHSYSDISSIHRITIDLATEKKEKWR